MSPPLLSRRRFLVTSGAATCLGALSKEAQAAPLDIRVAVKYHMIDAPTLSVARKFELLREVGLDGVELKYDDNIDLADFEEASEKTGLPIHGIVNAARTEILPAVAAARRLGGDSVLVLAAQNPELTFSENARAWQGHIRRALPEAEKLGIRLCVENVRATFLKTAEAMAEFVDSFESPFVRSYLDLGNTITWTDQSAEHWAEVLGSRIYKLDIKDRGHPEFGEPHLQRPGAIGTNGGEVHWERVRSHLRRIGFSGWATAEVQGGDHQRLAGIASWMSDVLDLRT